MLTIPAPIPDEEKKLTYIFEAPQRSLKIEI